MKLQWSDNYNYELISLLKSSIKCQNLMLTTLLNCGKCLEENIYFWHLLWKKFYNKKSRGFTVWLILLEKDYSKFFHLSVYFSSSWLWVAGCSIVPMEKQIMALTISLSHWGFSNDETLCMTNKDWLVFWFSSFKYPYKYILRTRTNS